MKNEPMVDIPEIELYSETDTDLGQLRDQDRGPHETDMNMNTEINTVHHRA